MCADLEASVVETEGTEAWENLKIPCIGGEGVAEVTYVRVEMEYGCGCWRVRFRGGRGMMGGNNGRATTFMVPLVTDWVCQQGIDVIVAKCNSRLTWEMIICAN